MQYNRISKENMYFFRALDKEVGTKTFEEATKDTRWLDAMMQENLTLQENDTWEVVALPPNKKLDGCKWV